MATSRHRLSILASILGLSFLTSAPIIFGATVGSHIGNGSSLQLNSKDTIQADAIEGGVLFYGLHTDPNTPSDFQLPEQIKISVGPAPQANTKFSYGIAVDHPAASITGQALTIDVTRTDSGKAAGISHIPLNNPGTAGPVSINLGTGSLIRVKGSGEEPGGPVPQPQSENNFAIGIGIWQRDLNLQADQLTLDIQSEKSDAYGISKSQGNDKNHNIDLGKGSRMDVQAGRGAYGISLDSSVTAAGQATPSLKADALTIDTKGAGAFALAVKSPSGTSSVDLGTGSQLLSTGQGAARAVDLWGQVNLAATDLVLQSHTDTGSQSIGLYTYGVNNSVTLSGTTKITSSGTGVHAYGVRVGSPINSNATQMHFDQVHITSGDYGMNVQGRVNLNLGQGLRSTAPGWPGSG